MFYENQILHLTYSVYINLFQVASMNSRMNSQNNFHNCSQSASIAHENIMIISHWENSSPHKITYSITET